MADFEPQLLTAGRDFGISRLLEYDRSFANDIGFTSEIQGLAEIAGVSGDDPWQTESSPLYLLRRALTGWDEEISDRFVVTMGEDVTIASISRIRYRHRLLELDDMRLHVGASIQFFNSFSHR
jgi:hypothetical protein